MQEWKMHQQQMALRHRQVPSAHCTAQTRLEPSSLGCLASFRGSLQAKLAEPSKVAKKSGERAAGTSLGISVKDNGAGYLSHGALTVLHFQILFWAEAKSTKMNKENN